MATPRKHWFRVADSILREPWTRDQKLMVVLLCAHLNQRWARDGLTPDQACRAVISPGVLTEITGTSHRGYAQKSLRTLEELLTISVRTRGELTEIHWPKFAEFQELRSRTRGNPEPLDCPEIAPSASASAEEKNKRKKRVSREDRSTPRAPRNLKPLPPDWALNCAELLIDLVRPVPGARIPRGARVNWAKEIAAIPREVPSLTGEDAAKQIEAGIRWALGPDNLGQEFEVVIRSGSSLRKKWPQLVQAAKRKGTGTKKHSHERILAWMNSVA